MKITIKNLQKRIPIRHSCRSRIKKAILKVFSLEGIKKSCEINVCFVNDEKIKEFNLRYRGKNTPTDVLVFDLTEKDKYLIADIIVSVDRAISQANIFKTYPLYELYLYVVHGILHLLGYDDRTAKQRKIMDKKAHQILTTLNIKH